MKEFRAQPSKATTIYDAVPQLVAESLKTGSPMFSNLNGTILVVDPAEAKTNPLYIDELVWTLEMAHHHAAIIGKQKRYANVVPELRERSKALIPQLFRSLEKPSLDILRWLIKLTPITWNSDMWTKKVNERLTSELEKKPLYANWSKRGLALPPGPTAQADYLVKDALASFIFQNKLSEPWFNDTNEWFDNLRS